MRLRIISTKEIVYDGEVSIVTLPGAAGAFTVLDHHASLISTLTAGHIQYGLKRGENSAGEHREMEIKGGIADIDNSSNTVNVCVF